MAVQFPDLDLMERQEDEAHREMMEGMVASYFDRVRRINYADWLSEIKSNIEAYYSDACLKAFEEGKFDKKLEKAFKSGKTYVWATFNLVRPWDIKNGTFVPSYDDDDSEYE